MRFVSGDWGTTRFRLRWIDGGVRSELKTEEGTAALASVAGDRAAAFKGALARGLEKLGAPAGLPVMISGMASSSIGWKELPYAALPFPLDGSGAVRAEVDRGVHLVSGLRSATDVMRGEETEALGAGALLGPDLPAAATLLMPGTHSKHVTVRDGRITGFRSFMTGELFELLSRNGVLRHSVDPAAPFDRASFVEGVKEEAPPTAALFRTRTRQVLDRRDAASNASFLSGVLVGAELRGLGGELLLCAGGALKEAYAAGLEALGLAYRSVDSELLAVKGQELLLARG